MVEATGAADNVFEEVNVMKLLAPLILAVTVGAPAAIAAEDDDDHSAHRSPEGAAAAPAVKAEHDHGGGQMIEHMKQNMKKLQDLMKQIQRTADPQARQQLLAEHLQAMREHVKMMRKMAAMDSGMGMMGKRDGGAKSDAPAGAGRRTMEDKGGWMMGGRMMMHQKMEARVDMLEQMLEQMIEREAAAEGL